MKNWQFWFCLGGLVFVAACTPEPPYWDDHAIWLQQVKQSEFGKK